MAAQRVSLRSFSRFTPSIRFSRKIHFHSILFYKVITVWVILWIWYKYRTLIFLNYIKNTELTEEILNEMQESIPELKFKMMTSGVFLGARGKKFKWMESIDEMNLNDGTKRYTLLACRIYFCFACFTRSTKDKLLSAQLPSRHKQIVALQVFVPQFILLGWCMLRL